MKEFFEEKVKKINISSPYLKNFESGWFAWEGSAELFSCRERFESAGAAYVSLPSNKRGGIYFTVKDESQLEKVAKFINQTEVILGLTDKQKCRYARTSNYRMLYVKVSDFWWANMMRISAFTIFLRAGLSYDPDSNNYEQALLSQDYFKKTQKALVRFLLGFTQFSANHGSWVNTFAENGGDKPNSYYRKLLKTDTEEIKTSVGIKTLWTS